MLTKQSIWLLSFILDNKIKELVATNANVMTLPMTSWVSPQDTDLTTQQMKDKPSGSSNVEINNYLFIDKETTSQQQEKNSKLQQTITSLRNFFRIKSFGSFSSQSQRFKSVKNNKTLFKKGRT